MTPGSNPSSKQKRANPIYENETQFFREKSPQTLGITIKMIPDLFGSGIMSLHYKKDRVCNLRPLLLGSTFSKDIP